MPRAKTPKTGRDPYAGYIRNAPQGVNFTRGARVEVRIDTNHNTHAWVGAEYVERTGRRTHAVRIDGAGSRMARRREIDSRCIREFGGAV